MPRVRMVLLGLAMVAGLIGVPAPAFAFPTVEFTTSPESFRPNGDGVDDQLDTAVVVSEPTTLRVYVIDEMHNAQVVAELLPRSQHDAGTVDVTWDGRDDAGNMVADGPYTLVANIGGPGNSGARLKTEVSTHTPGTFASPQPGARLAGSMDLAWTGWVGDVTIAMPGCGSWYLFQSEGDFTSQHDVSLAGCPSGRHELRATARWSDGFGVRHEAVVVIEVEVLGEGPHVVLMPGVSGDARNQTTVRSTDTELEKVSWPVRCSNADPASFELNVDNSDAETVRHFGRAPGSSTCGGGRVDWNGQDDNGDVVPDGTYTAVATVSDSEGRSASDEVEVVVDGEAPAVLTSPSSGEHLTTSTDLAWRTRKDVSITSVNASLPGCESFVAERDADGAYGLRDVDLTSCSPGKQDLSWTVRWRDGRNKEHTYRVRTPVELTDVSAPEIRPPGDEPRTRLLSPPSPGQRGSVSWPAYCRDGSDLVTYALVIRDESDRAVRQVPISNPTRCLGWGSPTFYGQWDGLDDRGAAVDDGAYEAVETFTDAAGLSSSRTSEILVDSRTPIRLDGLSDGDPLPANTSVSWTPRADVKVIDFLVVLTGQCDEFRHLTPQADGRFVATDVGAQSCVDDQVQLRWYVTWTDASGATSSWTDSIRLVRRSDTEAPVVTLLSHNELVVARADDTHLESITWALDCTDSSDVSLGTTVLDARQRPVRHWSPGPANLDACRDGDDYTTLVERWDGTDASGRVVPNGTYAVRFDVTDVGGHTTTVTSRVIVDGRVPGRLTAPGPGTAVTAGDQPYVFRPRGDLAGTMVYFDLVVDGGASPGRSFGQGADGDYRALVPVESTNGRNRLFWRAAWRDRNDDFHEYRSTPSTMFIHRPGDLSVTATPSWPFTSTTAQVEVGIHRPNAPDLTGSIDFGDGTSEMIESSAPHQSLKIDHVFPRAGTYVITVRARAATGSTTRSTAVGSVTVGTSATADDPPPTPTPTAPTPRVIRFARVGSALAARSGTWGTGHGRLAYQWWRDGRAITGATSSSYRLGSADHGHRLQVRVSGTVPGFGTVERFSEATAEVSTR